MEPESGGSPAEPRPRESEAHRARVLLAEIRIRARVDEIVASAIEGEILDCKAVTRVVFERFVRDGMI